MYDERPFGHSGASLMLEIIAEPSSSRCFSRSSKTGVQEYQRLGPDLGLETRAGREFVMLFPTVVPADV
jgi:hypothetical protein